MTEDKTTITDNEVTTDIKAMEKTIESQRKRLSESYEVIQAAYKVITENADKQRFIDLWDKFHHINKEATS